MNTTTTPATSTHPIYLKSLLTKKVILSMNEIGKNLVAILTKKLAQMVEGKCAEEGYIKRNSVKVITHDSGVILLGNDIEFIVCYECMVCHPVENAVIEAQVSIITKMGIHATVKDENGNIIIDVFVSREHHNANDRLFNNIKEHEKIPVHVLGIRYELNDTHIELIGVLHRG